MKPNGKPKYNLTKELIAADNSDLAGSTALCGMSGLTWFMYNNAMRTNMFTSHLRQFTVLDHPDPAKVFTGLEYVVGKYSDGYTKVKNRTEVYRKVVKYENIVENPQVYKLFIYDTKEKQYDVITRESSEDLSEIFGYPYNNDFIDSLAEGDFIEEEEVLYHSTSYDENMNYCYGKNVKIMFTLDPYTAEDGCVVDKKLAAEMTSTGSNTTRIIINENDFPLNLRGDKKHYKPFVDVGDTITDNILCCTRRQFNNQLLFDFKDSELQKIKDGDTKYFSNGKVVDIKIYCNNLEIPEISSNEQILKYLRGEQAFYQECYDICNGIMNSGKKYTREVDYLYKVSKDYLDNNKKWKLSDNAFSNIMIEIRVETKTPLYVGQKLTGRFGNKFVVSQIRDTEEMPFNEQGERVHLLLNLLAIINRTTAYCLFEPMINFITNKLRLRLLAMSSLKEQKDALFEVLRDLDDDWANEQMKIYNNLNKRQQEEYMKDCIEDGIYVRKLSYKEDTPIFFRLVKIFEKYDWLQPETWYVKKWGRRYTMQSKYYMGEMYILRLKQSSEKGFSARSTGPINSKDMPTRSYKKKNHQDRISSTCIRFGEFETYNFCIGVESTDLALFHAMYRTSIQGRKDLIKAIFDPEYIHKIDKHYTSIAAEIFSVIFKSLSLETCFVDDDKQLKELDNRRLSIHILDGMDYLCTDYQFYIISRIKECEQEVLEERGVLEKQDLRKYTIIKLSRKGYRVGPLKDYYAEYNVSEEEANKVLEEYKERMKVIVDTQAQDV